MHLNYPALVGVSHGTSSRDGARAVEALMESVANTHPELTVILGYVDVQHPDTTEALNSLPPGMATIVVPLLLSAGYHVHVDLIKAGQAQANRQVLITRALGPDPRLIDLLQRKLADVGFRRGDELILAVAGSSDKRAIVDCNLVASALAAAIGQRVTLGFLATAKPSLVKAIATARANHPENRIVVSSYLLAPGHFHALIERAGADIVTNPLLVPEEPAPWQLVEIIIDRYLALLDLQ